MPELKDPRDTVQTNLPSYNDSEVILWNDLLYNQVQELERSDTDQEAGLKTLLFLMKEWNMTTKDDDGEKVPAKINEENLQQLPSKDLGHLLNKVEEIMTEEGKDARKT